MPSTKPVSLDGSTLEGGGQLVRVALSLSAITGVPVHIYNIRANRAPRGRGTPSRGRGGHANSSNAGSHKVEGGLKESHLAALQFLAYHCDAYIEGAELSSREVTFIPGAGSKNVGSKSKGKGASLVDFQTNTIRLERPGSIFLILQAILPFLIFGKSRHWDAQGLGGIQEKGKRSKSEEKIELTLHGGTNVSKSMSAEYFRNVLLLVLQQIGIEGVEIEVPKRGWAGNIASTIGEVKVRVPRPPATGYSLPAFDLTERGELDSITVTMVGDIGVSKSFFEEHLGEVVAEHIRDVPVTFEAIEDSGNLRNFYLQLTAHTTSSARLSRDFLGTGKLPKNRAEGEKMAQVAIQTVVRELKAEIRREGSVDEFMQDQLVIFQALATGESRVDGGNWKSKPGDEEECGDEEGSLHTRTVRWVCNQMLSKTGKGIAFTAGGRCRGIGWNQQSDALEHKIDELSL